MGLLQNIVDKVTGKKKPEPVVDEPPQTSFIIMPKAVSTPKERKAGDYLDQKVDNTVELRQRVRAVAQNDRDLLSSTADLKLDEVWNNVLDDKSALSKARR